MYCLNAQAHYNFPWILEENAYNSMAAAVRMHPMRGCNVMFLYVYCTEEIGVLPNNSFSNLPTDDDESLSLT